MSDSGWSVADVHGIPPVDAGWGSSWKSVRHHFGISGFGVNAVSKGTGEVLIPEHDEKGSGQEELFFIHEGSAVAVLDGTEVRIPAGSFVAVSPGVRRQFSAAATPTTLIVVGAAPGRAFEVGAWEMV
jgi:mannose-6-phosphate isomerase-like protein (cupin superfamily)